MSSSVDKNQIRQNFLKARRKLDDTTRQHASQKILTSLQSWDVFHQASVIHTFLSQYDEVQTKAIIELCWSLGKTVVVPYLQPKSKVLGHSILSHFEQLQLGKFDILEPLPQFRQAIELADLELIFVPGVAFDAKGGRLGYGAGYYDRFLSQCQAFFLGLAFQVQISPSLPQAPHDISIHTILTEDGFLF